MIKLSAFADEADSNLSGQIKALQDNDIPYIEVRGINGKSVVNFSLEETKEYCKQLNDGGISVWSIGSSLGKVDINFDFGEYKSLVCHVCEIANIFNTNKIRMFSFYNAYGERNKVLDYLNQMVEIGREYGVDMYHENEKEIYGDTVDRVVDILDNVKGIKCVYDPANFIQCGQKSDYSLSLLHHRADYFHIKDVIASTQEIVPAGYGDGNILKLVKDICDDKVLTLEPHLSHFIGFDNIDNSQLKNKFRFENSRQAFNCAVDSIKNILEQVGYKQLGGKFVL